jgi:hypothetical protein
MYFNNKSFKQYHALGKVVFLGERNNVSYYSFAPQHDILLEASTADDMGKYHEIMYAHHSNGGKFADNDERKDDAEKMKGELESRLGPEMSKHISDKAKTSADAVKKMITDNGHKHHAAYWTSKPGDISRVTGVQTSQHENAGDVVHHISDHEGKSRYLSISLKHLGKSSAHAPTSNPGRGQTDKALGVNTDHHISTADRHLDKEFPHYSHLTQKGKKEAAKSDDAYAARSNELKKKAAEKVTDDHISAFNSMNHTQQVSHIRNSVHAHDTPDVPQMVVTSHSKGTRIENRAKKYHPDNISHIETRKKGWNSIEHTLHFKDGSHEVWQHRAKFESGPHSPLKGSFERTDRNE